MDRIDRINQALKEEISNILQFELKDPRLEFVSITRVAASRNLQYAKVYFSVLGDELKARAVQEGLDSASGFIRRLVGKSVRLRYTPEIAFIWDKSIQYSIEIEEKIEELKNEPSENYTSDQET